MVFLVNQAIQDLKVKKDSALKENLAFLGEEEKREKKVNLDVMVQKESLVSVHLLTSQKV
jgi:uncharacterized protein (DUF2344 family)